MGSEYIVTNFNEGDPEWFIVNDGVMGGLSKSKIYHKEDGIAIFEGELSLENNGGFASTRMRMESGIPAGFKHLRLKVKGDGNLYNFRIRINENFDGLAYDYEFQTKAGEWEDILIPLEKVQGTFRGRKYADKVGVVSEDISQIGILIANKQKGSFIIELDSIIAIQ